MGYINYERCIFSRTHCLLLKMLLVKPDLEKQIMKEAKHVASALTRTVDAQGQTRHYINVTLNQQFAIARLQQESANEKIVHTSKMKKLHSEHDRLKHALVEAHESNEKIKTSYSQNSSRLKSLSTAHELLKNHVAIVENKNIQLQNT